MADADERGPLVHESERLLRAIVTSKWWVQSDPPRVSSFAFKVDSPFSVNVASLMGVDEAVDHMKEVLHRPEGAIVSFDCGDARALEFDARQEIDPGDPDNEAHANVYYNGSNASRKKKAKQLAERCVVEHMPSFLGEE